MAVSPAPPRQPLVVTLLQVGVGLVSALVMLDIQTGGGVRRWLHEHFGERDTAYGEPFYGVATEAERFLQDQSTEEE